MSWLLHRLFEESEFPLDETGLNAASVWPTDPALARRVTDRLHERSALRGGPRTPAPGTALIVSVPPDQSAARLWQLGPVSHPPNGARLLDAAASAALAEGRSAALLTLPLFPSVERLDAFVRAGRTDLAAVPLCPASVSWKQPLAGRSLGLAGALAAASELLGHPCPSDLVGLATVDTFGRLGAVEGLAAKVEGVALGGLGVGRVVVAREQLEVATQAADRAAALARSLGVARRLEVVGLERLDELWPLVWDFDALAREAHAEREKRGDGADGETNEAVRWLLLLNAPAGGLSFPGWKGAAATLDALADVTAGAAREAARMAAAIARRHFEDGGGPLTAPSPELAALLDADELSLLAQRLQSDTDAGQPPSPELLREWMRTKLAPRRQPPPEQLQLAGALGRAFALQGAWTDAAEALSFAVSGWLSRGVAPAAAGRPLCELLRIAAMLPSEPGDLPSFVARFEKEVFGGAGHAFDRTFLTWALMRRAVTQGRPQEALEAEERLRSFPGVAQPYVALGIHRWRLAALRSLDAPRAVAELPQLVQDAAAMSDDIAGPLALLDDALATGGDVTAPLAHAERREPGIVSFVAGVGSPTERARRVVERYPY